MKCALGASGDRNSWGYEPVVWGNEYSGTFSDFHGDRFSIGTNPWVDDGKDDTLGQISGRACERKSTGTDIKRRDRMREVDNAHVRSEIANDCGTHPDELVGKSVIRKKRDGLEAPAHDCDANARSTATVACSQVVGKYGTVRSTLPRSKTISALPTMMLSSPPSMSPMRFILHNRKVSRRRTNRELGKHQLCHEIWPEKRLGLVPTPRWH